MNDKTIVLFSFVMYYFMYYNVLCAILFSVGSLDAPIMIKLGVIDRFIQDDCYKICHFSKCFTDKKLQVKNNNNN